MLNLVVHIVTTVLLKSVKHSGHDMMTKGHDGINYREPAVRKGGTDYVECVFVSVGSIRYS